MHNITEKYLGKWLYMKEDNADTYIKITKVIEYPTNPPTFIITNLDKEYGYDLRGIFIIVDKNNSILHTPFGQACWVTRYEFKESILISDSAENTLLDLKYMAYLI